MENSKSRILNVNTKLPLNNGKKNSALAIALFRGSTVQIATAN